MLELDARAGGRQRVSPGLGPLDEHHRAVEIRLQIAPLRGREPAEAIEVEVRDVHDARVAVPDRERRARDRVAHADLAAALVSTRQHESVVKLLAIFAQHLSMLSNQVVVQHENAEPPVITRAKEYIHEHQTEELSLGQVAKAVNTSTFYFCKMFKKVTGINFTDYLSRVRIEKAKNLLLNPNLRVSEIAFEVGFQSLTHFNRVFKKILGQSPTEYRAQLLGR